MTYKVDYLDDNRKSRRTIWLSADDAKGAAMVAIYDRRPRFGEAYVRVEETRKTKTKTLIKKAS